MMPEIIYPAILCLHSEIRVIRFQPVFEDGANLDLALVHTKRDGPLVCTGTGQAPHCGTIPGFWDNLRHGFTRFSLWAATYWFVISCLEVVCSCGFSHPVSSTLPGTVRLRDNENILVDRGALGDVCS